MLKKVILLFSLFLIVFFAGYKTNYFVSAKIDDSCQNISGLSLDQAISCQKQVEEELSSLKGALKPNEDKLNALKMDVKNIIARTAQIEADLNEKAALLEKGKEKIAAAKKIFDAKVRAYYKHQKDYSPILIIFANNKNISDLTKELTYQQKTANLDKQNIVDIALYVKDVEVKKTELENENTRLSSLKSSLSSQVAELENLVSGAKSYETKLVQTVAALSAHQQDLIAQRIGSLHLPTSLGSGPLICTDDRNVDPGFGNAFAFFTYGIPHRVGMNQYGAKGRADAGQNSDQILRAYFNFDGYQKFDGITIQVNDSDHVGGGNVIWTGSLDDYVRRIYEVPDSWPTESLKAQVIAARSYALAITGKGSSSICATQDCQVFKTDQKGGNWDQAVTDTAGQTMVQGGNPIKAYFSSTDGGYTWGSGDVWCDNGTYIGACGNDSATKRTRDTNGDVGGFGDLASKSYDKDSPCFYSAQGWRSEFGKSAWLKNDEVARIVNALMLAKAKGSAPDGIESWSSDKIKQELRNNNGSPIDSVSDISVSADFGIGKTNTITINGKSFDGLEFRNIFNLVAPANIAIVGPLYNVERK